MPRNGSYVKDLTVVEPDLSRVCLVDNSPASYAVNQGACARVCTEGSVADRLRSSFATSAPHSQRYPH